MTTRATVDPWLVDYEGTVAAFDWDRAWDDLGGRPDAGHGVNIADLALDRHVRAGRGDHVAIKWIGRDRTDVEAPVDLTYSMLATRTDRFACALRNNGFGPGTGVATLTGRIPDLYVTALGTLKAQGTFTPLFSAFGPDPIAQRLQLGHIRVLVTTPTLYRRKVAGIVDRLPDLELVLVCGATEDQTAGSPNGRQGGPRVMSFGAFLCDADSTFEIDRPRRSCTSRAARPGRRRVRSTCTVPSRPSRHGALVLDLHPDDVYWCTADPGWVTGTSYGIIAPLSNGVTEIVDEADFDAERWYRILERSRRRRLLHRTDGDPDARTPRTAELAATHDFRALRLVASVGEPLDASRCSWCRATCSGCPCSTRGGRPRPGRS
jgi:acetyl-CoA synthetase